MKVLIVSSLYHPNIIGGAEKIAQALAEGLVTRNCQPVVATLNPENRYTTAEVDGVRVHYLPVRNLYFPHRPDHARAAKMLWHALDSYNPLMAGSLGRILDAEHPDVVNTHNLCGFSVSVWKAAKARKVPVVHTTQDTYILCPRSSMRRREENCGSLCADCRIYSRPRRKLSRLVDVLTVPSRFMLDRHMQYGAFPTAAKLLVHNPCGVSDTTAKPTGEKRRPVAVWISGPS